MCLRVFDVGSGVLQRAAAGGQPPFILEGGVALELRVCSRSRAIKDVDLLLLEALVTDCQYLLKTCESVFQTRNTYSWPPPLQLPDHWIEPVARLIQELNLPIADALAGVARVRQFVDRVLC